MFRIGTFATRTAAVFRPCAISLAASAPTKPSSILILTRFTAPTPRPSLSSQLSQLRPFHSSITAAARQRRELPKRRPSEPEHVEAELLPAENQSQNVPTAEAGESFYQRLYKKGQLSDMEAPPVMSATARLLPSLLFTAGVIAASMYYGYTYTPTPPSERWFPDFPHSFAIVGSIIALNTAIFVAWKTPLPLTWRILNRFFISTPAYPYSASILGCVFSHQSLSHLGMNMFVLYIFGTTLCEQLGPGWFMALYLSAGAASSFGSLAFNVLMKRFHVTSLGASGAITGLIGAYACVNPEREVKFVLLPFLVMQAQTFVCALAAFETCGIVFGWVIFDHVAHLTGLAWGWGFAKWLMEEMKRRKEEKRRELQAKGWW